MVSQWLIAEVQENDWSFGLYGVSTIVGYLIPNLFLFK